MRYRLDTTANLQDAYAARLYELDYTPQGKQYKKRYRLTALVWLPIWWLVSYLVCPYMPDLLIFGLVTLVAEGVWQLLIRSNIRRRLLRQLRREEKQYGFGAADTFFYEDGFCDITEDIKYEVEYRHVRKAVIYKNSHFFLHTKKLFFIVPCRSLAGQASVGEFAEFLRSRGIPLESIE